MANIVTSAAESQLGKPYIWDTPLNANDPNPKSFDCSGLTMWCYNKAGIKLAHYTVSQFAKLASLDPRSPKYRKLEDAQPGDLVFFADQAANLPYHVALYMGNGQIIEAPEAGIPVRYRKVDNSTNDIVHVVGVFPGSSVSSTVAGIQLASDSYVAGIGTSAPVSGSLSGAVDGAGKFLGWFTDSHNWVRIGLGALAVILLVFTLIKLT